MIRFRMIACKNQMKSQRGISMRLSAAPMMKALTKGQKILPEVRENLMKSRMRKSMKLLKTHFRGGEKDVYCNRRKTAEFCAEVCGQD